MEPTDDSNRERPIGSPVVLGEPGTTAKSNPERIYDRLVNKWGITQSKGTAAYNELRHWTVEQVDEVFQHLDASQEELAPGVGLLLSFSARQTATELAREETETDFVKPMRDLVRQSADRLGALCVDSAGEFCVDPEEGYAALSHVWAQGLRGDTQDRGLHRSLLEQLFESIMTPLGAKWLWIDSLAIPGGGGALGAEDEELKERLINAMAGIYRNAKWVVIVDALMLRLNTVDHVSTAVALCCTAWMTRVWTYQEVKLAKRAVVATKAGFVSYGDMVDTLKEVDKLDRAARAVPPHTLAVEGNNDDQQVFRSRYMILYFAVGLLRRDNELEPGGTDLLGVAVSCYRRDASERLDYARALFPVLGLPWEAGDDLASAMRRVYEAKRAGAMHLVLYHGPPRAAYPGWAPAYLPGAEGMGLPTGGGPDVDWTARGLKREWCAVRVTGMRDIVDAAAEGLDEDFDFVLQLEDDAGATATCLAAASWRTGSESPESLRLVRSAVAGGSAWLLTLTPLRPGPTKPHRYVVLVDRAAYAGMGSDGWRKYTGELREGWVCVTLALTGITGKMGGARQRWLLLHENPTIEDGKADSAKAYMREQASVQGEPSWLR